MESTQHRVLQHLEARIVARGLECSQRGDYANTGSVHVYRPGETKALGVITYDFQSASYALTLTVNGLKVPSQPGRNDYFTFSSAYDKDNAIWAALEKHFPQVVPAKPAKGSRARP